MKKHLLKIAFFILSLTIGISLVWLLNSFIKTKTTEQSLTLKPEFEKPFVKKQGSGLEIKFKEFVETDYGILADFEITNDSEEYYIYRANIYDSNEKLAYTLTDVKIDGKKVEEWKCGSGLVNSLLKPGESKIFRSGTFGNHWKKSANVQIGFNFESKEVYQTYWSKNLPITDDIAEKLLIKQQGR